MNKELYMINQYGTITVNIKKYMDAKNRTRNALAKAIQVRFEVINKWYYNHVEKINADILVCICHVKVFIIVLINF